MERRKLVIGKYDTHFTDPWVLTALSLTDPDLQQNFQEIPGRDGPLDLSTVLTDGEPRYGSRILTATLETSEGTRQDRLECISKLVNMVDGQRLNIRHPDYSAYYLTGRVKVREEYNGRSYAQVSVTATCDPWLYSTSERVYTVTAAEEPQTLMLANNGRRSVVPQVTITGEKASFRIECGDVSLAMSEGTYKLPDLLLSAGNTVITYSGSGTAKLTYREAVLR